MLQKYLLFWLSLLSLIAWAWPAYLTDVPDPFVLSRPWIAYLFGGTMFVIGSLLPPDEVRQVYRRWPTVLGGTLIQYTSMPCLAFLVGKLFGLERDLMLGLILVGCVPGAMASNVITLMARGNISYSVSLTTSATLLSPLVVPLALFVTLQQTGIDAKAMAQKSFTLLLIQVVGPVVTGFVISLLSPTFKGLMAKHGPTFANLTILWIIAVVVNKNHTTFASAGFSLYVALFVVNLGGYAAGYFGGGLLKLTPAMQRALTLEVGMQNAGLGAVLAGQLFTGREQIELPAALYTFGCVLTGTILARQLAKRATDEQESTEELPAAEDSSPISPTDAGNST